MIYPITKHKKKNKTTPSEEEKKKTAFELGLHNDSGNKLGENVTNQDSSIVNIEEDKKVVNSGKG